MRHFSNFGSLFVHLLQNLWLFLGLDELLGPILVLSDLLVIVWNPVVDLAIADISLPHERKSEMDLVLLFKPFSSVFDFILGAINKLIGF
jgi:hypothetical protein